MKKFTATQNGRQVYCTLHSHFFGKDKVDTMRNDIILSLKSKIYQGDRRNFNFDKYCLAHVAEHNRYASLMEYGVNPLEESTKILDFEDVIKDPTLDAAQNAILVDRTRFQDFESMMNMYMTSKRSQKSDSGVSQGRQISAVTGGRGGGRGGGGAGRGGRGRGDPDARRKGLVSQADIDKVTLSRTSITLKKSMPSLLQPRRPSTGSSGTQGRNAAPVLPVAGSPESV